MPGQQPSRCGCAGRTAMALFLIVAFACARDDGRSVRFHDEDFPRQLSAWRLFVGPPAHLVSNSGVLPYDLNTALFTDYAHKYRTVWAPRGKPAEFRSISPFELPVGSILSKTFYYLRKDMRDARRKSPRLPQPPETAAATDRAPGKAEDRLLIETRLLVHTSSGWVALPYVWNAAQTEAELKVAGDQVGMDWTGPSGRPVAFDYVVPNQDQCAGCHVHQSEFKKALRPIGPIASNLNRKYDYAAGPHNQLVRWSALGLITKVPAGFAERMTNAADASTGSVEQRARDYLHVQCAHCHAETGPASTSGLILTRQESNAHRLGRCKSPVAAGRGSGGLLYDIVPGNPRKSILHFRMDSTEADIMMPEIGRSLIHGEGVKLIRTWILEMEGECS